MTRWAHILGAGLCSLLANLPAAWASGNFLCTADDASLRFSAESTVSHGLGGAFLGFSNTVESRIKDTPADLSKLDIDGANLVHHWFADGDLNLHVYRERAGDAPHGYVELIVTTQQNARDDDESAYEGSYELTEYDVGEHEGQAKTLTANGKVSCSVE